MDSRFALQSEGSWMGTSAAPKRMHPTTYVIADEKVHPRSLRRKRGRRKPIT
jgi:hypothetical protein